MRAATTRLRRPSSPFGRRAKRRNTLAKIRARAPKHPIGPEQQIRAAVTRIFRAYHKRLREQIVESATRNRQDADDTKGSVLLHSVFAAAAAAAHQLLYQSPFKRILAEAAAKTAASAAKQTASALSLDDDFDPDLDDIEARMANGIFVQSADLMTKSTERAEDIWDEWSELDPETSPRAGDTDALGSMLDDGLDGITGTALAWASMQFGYGFGDMIKGAQQDAGVSTYMWLSQRDSHVRPEHEALDGQVCSWDDPPLTEAESTSGEECHPGEDFNCRCVASPLSDDEPATDAQLERFAN